MKSIPCKHEIEFLKKTTAEKQNVHFKTWQHLFDRSNKEEETTSHPKHLTKKTGAQHLHFSKCHPFPPKKKATENPFPPQKSRGFTSNANPSHPKKGRRPRRQNTLPARAASQDRPQKRPERQLLATGPPSTSRGGSCEEHGPARAQY